MPRARDPAREKAREMWEASGRTLKLREIAERLNIPEKTISGWKSKDGWDKKNERSTPKKKRSTPNHNTPNPAIATAGQQLMEEQEAEPYDNAERAPWERKSDESSKAFEAFAIYRDMGTNRSIYRVGQKLVKSVSFLSRWSVQFDWVNRATAWDEEQDRIVRDANLQTIKEMNDRQANIATYLQGKMLKALKELDVKGFKPQDIVRGIEVGMKQERVARGAISPMERHKKEYDLRRLEFEQEKAEASRQAQLNKSETVNDESQPSSIDLSGLSDEELMQLEKYIGKLHAE